MEEGWRDRGRNKDNNRMSLLHCIQTAVTEWLDLGKQTHQLKQLHLHHGCTAGLYLYFFLFVLHLLPEDYCTKYFPWRLANAGCFHDDWLGTHAMKVHTNAVVLDSPPIFDWTDHQSSQTTSAKNLNFNSVVYIQNRDKYIHTHWASCKIHHSPRVQCHIAAKTIPYESRVHMEQYIYRCIYIYQYIYTDTYTHTCILCFTNSLQATFSLLNLTKLQPESSSAAAEAYLFTFRVALASLSLARGSNRAGKCRFVIPRWEIESIMQSRIKCTRMRLRKVQTNDKWRCFKAKSARQQIWNMIENTGYGRNH